MGVWVAPPEGLRETWSHRPRGSELRPSPRGAPAHPPPLPPPRSSPAGHGRVECGPVCPLCTRQIAAQSAARPAAGLPVRGRQTRETDGAESRPPEAPRRAHQGPFLRVKSPHGRAAALWGSVLLSREGLSGSGALRARPPSPHTGTLRLSLRSGSGRARPAQGTPAARSPPTWQVPEGRSLPPAFLW